MTTNSISSPIVCQTPCSKKTLSLFWSKLLPASSPNSVDEEVDKSAWVTGFWVLSLASHLKVQAEEVAVEAHLLLLLLSLTQYGIRNATIQTFFARFAYVRDVMFSRDFKSDVNARNSKFLRVNQPQNQAFLAVANVTFLIFFRCLVVRRAMLKYRVLQKKLKSVQFCPKKYSGIFHYVWRYWISEIC